MFNLYPIPKQDSLGARGLSCARISLILHTTYVSYIFLYFLSRLLTKACRERTSGTQSTGKTKIKHFGTFDS